jgi:hypothetical protein
MVPVLIALGISFLVFDPNRRRGPRRSRAACPACGARSSGAEADAPPCSCAGADSGAG